MTEILLDHGASVNARDNDGDTPLHITLAKESVLKTNLVAQLVNMRYLFFLFIYYFVCVCYITTVDLKGEVF